MSGDPGGIKKFAVDKLRYVTPVRLSLLSTVERVATLVISYSFESCFVAIFTAVNDGLK